MLWESGIQGKSWRVIKEIYRNVENNAVFGDFESDWFEQEYGVKQGCVLFPTLFSVLMNDLVDMLRQSNFGIDITSQLINCLLFADDVVLMANSQDELQKILQISHNFACKWNLRFNSKKSKVMVIGKNLNKNSNWVLGNENIDEVNEYKYLSHFINRSMKSNYHINTYLKSKSENQMNYLIRILGECVVVLCIFRYGLSFMYNYHFIVYNLYLLSIDCFYPGCKVVASK